MRLKYAPDSFSEAARGSERRFDLGRMMSVVIINGSSVNTGSAVFKPSFCSPEALSTRFYRIYGHSVFYAGGSGSHGIGNIVNTRHI